MNTFEIDKSSFPRWQDLTATLLRQRRLILLVTLFGTAVAMLVLVLRAPTYEASAHLAVIPERSRVIVSPDPKTGTVSEGVTEQDLNSEVALLKSDQLLREVLKARHAEDPAPAAPRSTFNFLSLPSRMYQSLHRVPSDPIDYELREVQDRLEIQGIKNSNLIRISYSEQNPERAAALVNTLAERHVQRPAPNSQEDARKFFEHQRELLYASRVTAEQALRSFYERESIGMPPESAEALRTQLIELKTTGLKAQTSLAEAEARTGFLRVALQNHPKMVQGTSAGANDPLMLVRARIVDLELQRSNLLGQFAPTSSRVQDIDRQLQQARALQHQAARDGSGVLSQTRESLALALAKTEAEAAGLKARVEAVNAQIARDQPRLAHLESIASERERLEQEVASAREALQTYRRKEEEARFSSALDRSRIVNVSIVEPARVPTAPLPSANMLAALLAALFSFIIGTAIALVRDRFDTSVKSIEEAAELSRAPVLGDMTY